MTIPPKYEDLVLKVAELEQRLSETEEFLNKMVCCTKGQDSIATGYLSDILDVLKGSQSHD